MDLSYFIFLSSGLFLGWSLGANDAANVFGTAVGTKMVRFRTAAVISSFFLILGAVYSGGGTTETLTRLGNVNALPGAFMVALSAAVSVYWMIKGGLPVSTSQAIVGAIIGWNFYSGRPTDLSIVSKIVSTWVICPVLAGILATLIYFLVRSLIKYSKIHLIRQDLYTRIGLIVAGAFGAYALGANNIANVMGVFVDSAPFQNLKIGSLDFSPEQILFFIGGIAVRHFLLFAQNNKNHRQRAYAHVSDCRLDCRRLTIAGFIHVCFRKTGKLSAVKRAAGAAAGTGFQFAGRYRRHHRHRFGQRRPQHKLEHSRAHSPRLDIYADNGCPALLHLTFLSRKRL